MECQYCENRSGKTDGRGNCVSCGGPVEKEKDHEMDMIRYWTNYSRSGLMSKGEARNKLSSNFLIDDVWNGRENTLDYDKMIHHELLKLGYTMYDIVEIDSGFGNSRTLPAVVQRGDIKPNKFKIKFDMGFPGGIVHIQKIEDK